MEFFALLNLWNFLLPGIPQFLRFFHSQDLSIPGIYLWDFLNFYLFIYITIFLFNFVYFIIIYLLGFLGSVSFWDLGFGILAFPGIQQFPGFADFWDFFFLQFSAPTQTSPPGNSSMSR